MEEIWKDIKNFEGCYQVSNYGRVRSLDRIIEVIQPGRIFNIKRKGTILSPSLNTNGYPHIQMRKNDNKRIARVHRLVAEAFIENPNNFGLVNHIDSCKTNNHIENLEWCSENYNRHHAREIFNDTAYGELCHLSVLTEENVREIRANGRMGLTNAQIGEKYNVSHETIRCVLSGKSWKHIL